MKATDPKPGDRWDRPGHAPIEVVAVKSVSVYCTQAGRPIVHPIGYYQALAEESLRQGAVLTRDGAVYTEEEEFVV